jgi:acyl-CoA thioester hydrolase
MSGPFRHRMRVRFNECDPQGVVFYANYLAYFDIAMTELYREALGSFQALLELGADLVVAEAGIRYRASARFDDELDLVARVGRLGTTSTTTAVAIERAGDGELLVEGELRHVCVDPKTLRKRELPPEVLAALRPYVAADAQAADDRAADLGAA